jgi:hypothetical protein
VAFRLKPCTNKFTIEMPHCFKQIQGNGLEHLNRAATTADLPLGKSLRENEGQVIVFRCKYYLSIQIQKYLQLGIFESEKSLIKRVSTFLKMPLLQCAARPYNRSWCHPAASVKSPVAVSLSMVDGAG